MIGKETEGSKENSGNIVKIWLPKDTIISCHFLCKPKKTWKERLLCLRSLRVCLGLRSLVNTVHQVLSAAGRPGCPNWRSASAARLCIRCLPEPQRCCVRILTEPSNRILPILFKKYCKWFLASFVLLMSTGALEGFFQEQWESKAVLSSAQLFHSDAWKIWSLFASTTKNQHKMKRLYYLLFHLFYFLN